MLVEIAIGDSYGAGFEFTKPWDRVKKNLINDLCNYYSHNMPGHMPGGSYTDDTQMSIALARALLDPTRKEWNKSYLTEVLFQTFRRDPRDVYSRKMQNILEKAVDATQFGNIIIPFSDRCGASIRSCPLGLIPKPTCVWEKAVTQAKITHNTPDGIRGSVVTALAVHHQYYKLGQTKDMCEWIAKFICDSSVAAIPGSTTAGQFINSTANRVVSCAISAVIKKNPKYKGRMSILLKQCNNYFGDTDSISAIALGIASVSDDWENDLPENLFTSLENGKYGLDYLKKIDQKLFRKYPR